MGSSSARRRRTSAARPRLYYGYGAGGFFLCQPLYRSGPLRRRGGNQLCSLSLTRRGTSRDSSDRMPVTIMRRRVSQCCSSTVICPRRISRRRSPACSATRPLPPGPKNPTCHIAVAHQLLVVTRRTLLGWCGQRIRAELERRQICKLSHTSVYRIFPRYHMKVRTYHPKSHARSSSSESENTSQHDRRLEHGFCKLAPS